jgi:arginine/lysine/ornithine decarboxylase
MTPSKAFFSDSQYKDSKHAIGYICADVIVCYPPGIPILCPGELICREHIEYIDEVKKCGGNVLGMSEDQRFRTVKNL